MGFYNYYSVGTIPCLSYRSYNAAEILALGACTMLYDLIIVGGGPSGAAAGRQAGKLGLRTALIEKEIFPRYKPCGGALSIQAMSYLDFKIPEELIQNHIYGARIHYRGQFVESYKPYTLGALVTRSDFDQYLLEKAGETGIDIIMGEKVISYKEKRDNVEIYTKSKTRRARFVIVAEGAQGKLKKRIRRSDTKNEYGICLVTEIKEDNSIVDEYLCRAIDIHFGVARMGYGWVFPHKEYFSVGIGGLASHMSSGNRKISRFLEATGFGGNYRSKGHLIPYGGIRRNTVSARVILVGDAAGFVDPFYGEGLAYAIRSGQIAVDVVSNIVLGEKNPSLLKNYERLCWQAFGKNLRYSLILAKVSHCLPGIFFRIFASNQVVVDKLIDVCSSAKTYKSFLFWLIPRIPLLLWSRGSRPFPPPSSRVPSINPHK